MNCPMRRPKQKLPQLLAADYLKIASNGILAVSDESVPYQIPFSFAFEINPDYEASVKRESQDLSQGKAIPMKAGCSLSEAFKKRDCYAKNTPEYIGNIYFHGASKGHIIDLIDNGCPASFCIIDQDEIIPSELTTHYRSVIAQGVAEPVLKPIEKRHALELIGEKYAPDYPEKINKTIDRKWNNVAVYALRVKSLVGKEASALMKARFAETDK